MTGKQRRFLRAMASTMPAVVQIGKAGLENPVIDSVREALMAHELVKIKNLNNSPEDSKEVFERLADMMGAELIQVIGHNGVIYKRSKKHLIELP